MKLTYEIPEMKMYCNAVVAVYWILNKKILHASSYLIQKVFMKREDTFTEKINATVLFQIKCSSGAVVAPPVLK